MKIDFVGDISGLAEGIKILTKELDFDISPWGVTVHVEKSSDNIIQIIKKGQEVFLKYPKKIHFFRALGLLIETMHEKDGEFEIVEFPQFSMNGVMFDVSQSNALINVENIKNILSIMAVMGLNMLMLYMEDCFEVEDEPYFGYMLESYSYQELKECDDYADIFGIEMIPCIQTLAHLRNALKWSCFVDLKDDEDTLLVGYPRTYEFIEKLLMAASAPFRSRRIHIGMDEACNLGMGKYLLRNGFKSKSDIMNEHLGKVLEITSRLGLKPMIWSDMYFRTDSLKVGNYDPDARIPESVIKSVSEELQMVYWDYYIDEEDFHAKVIRKHREFGRDPIFAGGIWNWIGFGVNYGKTFLQTNAALNACKKEGIKEVFATLWGDDGNESNIFSNLLGFQLFAEHGYSRKLDMNKLKKRFKFCTGAIYDDFMDIMYLDQIPGVRKDQGLGQDQANPCKYLLWQDILAGLFDSNIKGLGMNTHYENLRKRFGDCKNTNGKYGFLFEMLEKLCSVLSIKAEIGLILTEAYRNKNTALLTDIAENVLPELYKKVKDLRDFHRDLWYKTVKPLGWTVLDIRYGGTLMRIDTAILRIHDYLDGKVEKIEELEAKRLDFDGKPGLIECNIYKMMPTAFRISRAPYAF